MHFDTTPIVFRCKHESLWSLSQIPSTSELRIQIEFSMEAVLRRMRAEKNRRPPEGRTLRWREAFTSKPLPQLASQARNGTCNYTARKRNPIIDFERQSACEIEYRQ